MLLRKIRFHFENTLRVNTFRISECRLLGVHIYQNLSFNTCSYFISKLYSPLIHSQIDHCLSVWGNCPYTFLSTVQKLQNKIAHFLTCKYDYNLYSSCLLRSKLKWMSVSERYQYFTSILRYKCMNNHSNHLYFHKKMSIIIK